MYLNLGKVKQNNFDLKYLNIQNLFFFRYLKEMKKYLILIKFRF